MQRAFLSVNCDATVKHLHILAGTAVSESGQRMRMFFTEPCPSWCGFPYSLAERGCDLRSGPAQPQCTVGHSWYLSRLRCDPSPNITRGLSSVRLLPPRGELTSGLES